MEKKLRMKFRMLVLAGLLAFFASCSKEKFPDEFSIYGKWKEFTNDTIKTEVEFRRRNIMLLNLIHDTIREYNYLLEKSNELEIFEPSEFPNGISSKHRIAYNKKEDQMSIYGLYPSINEASVTVFVRK